MDYEKFLDVKGKQLAGRAIRAYKQRVPVEEAWIILDRVKERIRDGHSIGLIEDVIDFKIRENQKHPKLVFSEKVFDAMVDETIIGIDMKAIRNKNPCGVRRE